MKEYYQISRLKQIRITLTRRGSVIFVNKGRI
jgi:hypothetical protein